jgi:hypothetical protein
MKRRTFPTTALPVSEVHRGLALLLTYLSGIHGRPYREWGGAAGDNNAPGAWEGYCTHSSILFAPWHRPYLALFEVRCNH